MTEQQPPPERIWLIYNNDPNAEHEILWSAAPPGAGNDLNAEYIRADLLHPVPDERLTEIREQCVQALEDNKRWWLGLPQLLRAGTIGAHHHHAFQARARACEKAIEAATPLLQQPPAASESENMLTVALRTWKRARDI